MIGDKGLVVKNIAAHHAISAPFEVALDNEGKTLVIQYILLPMQKLIS